MCALQDMIQDILTGEVEWMGIEEALNDSRVDEAAVHFLRAITALQMLTHKADYHIITVIYDE